MLQKHIGRIDLYADNHGILDVDTSGYALDATTIGLRLSPFEWARFRSTQDRGQDTHTLLDLRGAIPYFMHISDGKMHEVKVLRNSN